MRPFCVRSGIFRILAPLSDPDHRLLMMSILAMPGLDAPERVTDNSLWWKNVGLTEPPQHYQAVLQHIGKRFGVQQEMEQARLFVQMFRQGKLGRYTLDYFNI
jgi:hypothetical protein